MRIIYFGSYDPNYPRNRVLIKGLRENGVEVLECRDNSRGIKKFIKLFFKLRKMPLDYDAVVVGFLGHQLVPWAKILTNKPIILDAFISLYDSNVLDRKITGRYTIRALYYWFLDWLSMRCADLVFFDTDEHIKYVSRKFGIKKKKFRRIFVGTDPDIFYLREKSKSDNGQNTVVHFHGSFIPLQGVEYIIKAAHLLRNENIEFHILGNGQTYADIIKLSGKLGIKNVRFLEKVRYDELPEFISQADICLGIFGNTSKTRRVIPNKVYEYAAMAKPIITADTPAIRELFDDQDLKLAKAADPESLAAAIRALDDSQDKEKLGMNAYNKIKQYATPKILGSELVKAIQEIA